jgi:hypothetical protein
LLLVRLLNRSPPLLVRIQCRAAGSRAWHALTAPKVVQQLNHPRYLHLAQAVPQVHSFLCTVAIRRLQGWRWGPRRSGSASGTSRGLSPGSNGPVYNVHGNAVHNPRRTDVTREPDEEPQHGLFEPLTPGEELIEAIAHDDVARAAQLLRRADNVGQPGLSMLADLLDGDPKANPELPQLYPYRLKIASWGNAGRKPKGSRAKAKSNSGYRRKLSPRPSNQMLALKVRRLVDTGATRADAIEAVATASKLSKSLVEKAYDTLRRRIRVGREPN